MMKLAAKYFFPAFSEDDKYISSDLPYTTDEYSFAPALAQLRSILSETQPFTGAIVPALYLYNKGIVAGLVSQSLYDDYMTRHRLIPLMPNDRFRQEFASFENDGVRLALEHTSLWATDMSFGSLSIQVPLEFRMPGVFVERDEKVESYRLYGVLNL